MKKIIGMILSLAVAFGTFPTFSVFADSVTYAGGSGTASDPYLISNADQLKKMRDDVNGDMANTSAAKASYRLTCDIDLGGIDWTPIGSGEKNTVNNTESENVFNGTFDGNGYTVSNFKVTTGEFLGFFGQTLENSVIKNLVLDKVTVNANLKKAGASAVLAARVAGSISLCAVKNSSVYADSGRVCGFVGQVRRTTTFDNCYVYNTSVKADNSTGSAIFATIENSNEHNTYFTNCYAAETTTESPTITHPFVFAQNSDKDKNAVPTLVNCFTDMKNALGGLEYGTIGATKEGIAAAMINSGYYEMNENLNNGEYPCLSLETGWKGDTASAFDGGSGTTADPYKISTPAQLAYARDLINADTSNTGYSAKSYELTNDIDFCGREWFPIGLNSNNDFRGQFNGNGHVLKNFKITSLKMNLNNTEIKADFAAVFSHITGATIENLGIENVTINGDLNAAGLVGRGGGNTYKNCYVKNFSYTASNHNNAVGGFIYSLRSGSQFINCYVYDCDFTVGNASRSGGFVGSVENANGNQYTFKNCYTAGITIHEITQNNKAAMYPFINNVRIYEYALAQGDKEKGEYNNDWKSVTFTLTDCYAEQSGADGSSQNFIAEASKGELGKSKADIISKLVTDDSDCMFKTDSGINEGFPSLKSEESESTPKNNSYVVAAVSGEEHLKVTLLENTYRGDAKVYVAVYDSENRLTDAAEYAVSEFTADNGYTKETSVSVPDGAKVRVFVWDDDLDILAQVYKNL